MGERTEAFMIDAHGHDVELLGPHAHLRDDVTSARLAHRDDARNLFGDLDLHAQESVPATQTEPALPAGVKPLGLFELEIAVDRDGVVQRSDDGESVFADAGDSVPEALIVVDDVIVGWVPTQVPPGP